MDQASGFPSHFSDFWRCHFLSHACYFEEGWRLWSCIDYDPLTHSVCPAHHRAGATGLPTETPPLRHATTSFYFWSYYYQKEKCRKRFLSLRGKLISCEKNQVGTSEVSFQQKMLLLPTNFQFCVIAVQFNSDSNSAFGNIQFRLKNQSRTLNS